MLSEIAAILQEVFFGLPYVFLIFFRSNGTSAHKLNSVFDRHRFTRPAFDTTRQNFYDTLFLSIDMTRIGNRDYVVLLSKKTIVLQGAFFGFLYVFLINFRSNHISVPQFRCIIERCGSTTRFKRAG